MFAKGPLGDWEITFDETLPSKHRAAAREEVADRSIARTPHPLIVSRRSRPMGNGPAHSLKASAQARMLRGLCANKNSRHRRCPARRSSSDDRRGTSSPGGAPGGQFRHQHLCGVDAPGAARGTWVPAASPLARAALTCRQAIVRTQAVQVSAEQRRRQGGT